MQTCEHVFNKKIAFQGCLQRSFSANVYQCPSCRSELGNNIDTMKKNENLSKILLYFFPSYTAGR